ncbi:probable cytochrome P450 6a14 [Tenebrio molitor]|uniref:probable cytochrome P450 6a14 n=1 Tax=Tenebrio molitor TaxID=7067 RepID=UPI003624AB3B
MLLIVEGLLVTILLVVAYYKYSFRYWKRRNVPYVTPTIPWGNYPNAIKRKIHYGQQIVNIYHQMKKQGHRYFGIYQFFQPCFVPIDPKYLRLIMSKDFHCFYKRNFYYNAKDDPISAHLVSLNGDKWKKLRSKMTPTFTTGKIKMLFKIYLECGKILGSILEEHCQKGTPVNIKEMFSSFSTDVIVNCAFGLEVDFFKKAEFSKHSRKALDFDMVRSFVMYLGAVFPDLCRKLGFRQVAKSSADFFLDIVRNTVNYREKTNTTRNDFLQLLINLKNEKVDGEEFTIEEIAAQCFIFFLAGFETSATTMAFALFEIALNPAIYQKLMEEITVVMKKSRGEITYDAIKEMIYLHQIVEETLRKHSPVYFVTRLCTKDYHFPDSDVVLKEGSQVLIPIRGLHSDPEFFPDPEKFDPDRFHPDRRHEIDPYSYIPFGEGPRNCIGLRFGMMEIKTALVTVLRDYKFMVNPRTHVPVQPSPISLMYDAIGGLWLDCEKIST